MIAALDLARPLGLVALLVPLTYLLFAHHLVRPTWHAVGSLGLWTRVGRSATASAANTRWTWRTLVLFGALLALALCVAGPRFIGAREPRVWTLVLGTGAAGDLAPAGTSERRIDLAVEAGLEFTRARPRGDRFLWAVGTDEERVELGVGEAPDVALLAALAGAPPREWARFDLGDHVWLPVDGAPLSPEAAGLRQPAFAPAPGLVAHTDAGTWSWGGERLGSAPVVQLATGEMPAPRLFVEGAALAPGEPLRRFAEAFAGARGWLVEELGARGSRPVLTLSGPAREVPSAATRGEVGRDGWTAGAEWLPEAPTALGLVPFLGAAGVTLVASGPGRITTRLVHLDEPEGDPAAFAVSFAELFERVALPAVGVVAQARRAGAPARSLVPGLLRDLDGVRREAAPVDSLPLEAPLALLAGLLFVLARR